MIGLPSVSRKGRRSVTNKMRYRGCYRGKSRLWNILCKSLSRTTPQQKVKSTARKKTNLCSDGYTTMAWRQSMSMNVSSVISQSPTSSALTGFSKAWLPKNCSAVTQCYWVLLRRRVRRSQGQGRGKKRVADDADISTSTGTKAKANKSRPNTPPLTKGPRKGRSWCHCFSACFFLCLR